MAKKRVRYSITDAKDRQGGGGWFGYNHTQALRIAKIVRRTGGKNVRVRIIRKSRK